MSIPSSSLSGINQLISAASFIEEATESHSDTPRPDIQLPTVNETPYSLQERSLHPISSTSASSSSHQTTNKPYQHKQCSQSNNIIVVKEEAESIPLFLPHRIDNQSPLWSATEQIKQEISQLSPNKTSKVIYQDITEIFDKKTKFSIKKQITNYIDLSNVDREQHLNIRMKRQRYKGNVPALKKQYEVVAAKDINQWEILGHYAGTRFSNKDYQQGQGTVGAPLSSIDKYSYTVSRNAFISGYRCGNVTSCINAHTTYNPAENKATLPQQNVSFIGFQNEQKIYIPFVIAIQHINKGEALWLDYGEQYWKAMREKIEVSDLESDEEVIDKPYSSTVQIVPASKAKLNFVRQYFYTKAAGVENKVVISSLIPALLPLDEQSPSSSPIDSATFRHTRTKMAKKNTNHTIEKLYDNTEQACTSHTNLKVPSRTHTDQRSHQCTQCDKIHMPMHNLGLIPPHSLTKKEVARQSSPVLSGSGEEAASSCTSHVPQTHSGGKANTCEKCGMIFRRAYSLKMHQRAHTGEKPFSCDQCEKRFSYSSSLKTHQKTHTNEKPFPCTKCEKRFSQKVNLKTHQKTHTNEKPFPCTKCEKRFSYSSSLKSHQKTHTNEKPFSCPQCEKRFSLLGNLKKHQKNHTDEKPFSCVTCGKNFSLSGNLKKHQISHTGEKPFSCEQCGKRFPRSSYLKSHQKIHTGEKPFSCKQCGKCFSQSSNLKSHQKIHTKN